MRIIHLLRKPLGESSVAGNVLKYGCGALNVDACRIATGDNLDGGAYAEQGTERWDGAENWRYKRLGGAGEFQQPPGRWPANLVIEHRLGCRRVGTKRVKPADGSGRAGPGGHGFRTAYVGGDKKGEGFTGGFVGDDGTEVVDAWECVPGCPVVRLDEQSGDIKSTGRYRDPPQSAGGSFGGGACTNDYAGEAGGASRFFKQVGETDR